MTLYATIEAALLIRVRALDSGATFTTANSSRGDWSVRDAAGQRISAVLFKAKPSVYADSFPPNRGSHGKRQELHTIGIQVAYARQDGQGGDGATYTALQTTVDNLIAWLNQWPRLNATTGVRRGQVTESTAPIFNAGKTHLIVGLMLMVNAEIELSQQESAQ